MLPLVKASYPARATATPIKFGETSKDGEARYQIAVEFQIDVTDDRADLDEYAHDTITWIGHFTDATAERTLESLQIAGWKGEDVSELAGVPGSDVLQDQVSLACDVDDYEGKSRLKVQWVNRPRTHFAFKQEASADSLRALGARLRATAKAVRAGGGQKRQRTDRQPAGGGLAQRGYGGNGGRANAPGDRDDVPPPGDSDW